MAVQIQTLIAPTQLASAITTYFTAGVPTQVNKMTLTNNSNATRFVSVYWVPQGAAADATNQIVPNRALQPGEMWDVVPMMGHVMSSRDQIAAVCDSNVGVIFAASGTGVS